MANPPPISPVVLNGHLPVQDIDLSDAQYPRDGVIYQPTNPNIVRESDAVILQNLTQSINNSAHVSTLGKNHPGILTSTFFLFRRPTNSNFY